MKSASVVVAVLVLGWVWMQSHVRPGTQALPPLGVGRAGRTPLKLAGLEEGKRLLGNLPDHLKGAYTWKGAGHFPALCPHCSRLGADQGTPFPCYHRLQEDPRWVESHSSNTSRSRSPSIWHTFSSARSTVHVRQCRDNERVNKLLQELHTSKEAAHVILFIDTCSAFWVDCSDQKFTTGDQKY